MSSCPVFPCSEVVVRQNAPPVAARLCISFLRVPQADEDLFRRFPQAPLKLRLLVRQTNRSLNGSLRRRNTCLPKRALTPPDLHPASPFFPPGRKHSERRKNRPWLALLVCYIFSDPNTMIPHWTPRALHTRGLYESRARVVRES